MNQTNTNLWSDHIESRREYYGIPCIAAGIVRDGELSWFQGFGETEIGSGRAPHERSRFRIASNTKPLTATALMMMAESSMLTFEDSLMLHIPEFTSAATPVGDLEDVTLRRLATHHSGIVTEHPDTNWSQHAFPTMSRVLDTVHAVRIVLPPDQAWKYSNLAYGLLGEVVERLSGKPYRRWVTEEILGPLGMSETVFELGEIPAADRVTGYIPAKPGSDTLRPAPDFSLNGVDAAGGLRSNVNDLATWIGFMMSDDSSATGIDLSQRSKKSMLTPEYVDANWNRGQCVGWRTERVANLMCHTHSGGIHGFGTSTLWSISEQIGVIVLTSVWPGKGAAQLARDLMKMAVSPPEEPPAVYPDNEVPVQTDHRSPFGRLTGSYLAEPGLSREVTAISDGQLHLGTEESAIDGEIEVIADPNADGSFTVMSGRAAGESIAFSEDLTFRMSNFTYERIDLD